MAGKSYQSGDAFDGCMNYHFARDTPTLLPLLRTTHLFDLSSNIQLQQCAS
jgi:hypothetical protein